MVVTDLQLYGAILVFGQLEALYATCQHSEAAVQGANLLIRSESHSEIWGSVFCPRTLQHAGWRSQNRDLKEDKKKLHELQIWGIILCFFITMSDRFHTAHGH